MHCGAESRADESTSPGTPTPLSIPIVVEIGAGETALGPAQGLVESLYVSSHNKGNRRYAQRAFDALTAELGADLESLVRSAFGCESGATADLCSSVVVLRVGGAAATPSDVGEVVERKGWPKALWLTLWVQSSPEGIAIRGFVQPYPLLPANSRAPVPLGYIEAAPDQVMEAASRADKPDEWLMDNYWLGQGPSPLPAVFARGLVEMNELLAYAVPAGNFAHPVELRIVLKKHDQLRYLKDQGIGCRNLAHCNSQLVKQFPSRIWVWRAAVGYAYLTELVSEPIVKVGR